jgi:hypothetical protein
MTCKRKTSEPDLFKQYVALLAASGSAPWLCSVLVPALFPGQRK